MKKEVYEAMKISILKGIIEGIEFHREFERKRDDTRR